MTLDTYADLFEDDLNAVAERLHERAIADVDPVLMLDLGEASFPTPNWACR
jgi:hypothetical protein